MVTCSVAQVNSKINAVRDIIASYYVYYTTCKTDAQQSPAERSTSRGVIANIHNSNPSFRSKFNDLACAWALGASNTTVQNTARNLAGVALGLTGRVAKDCGGGSSGGGGGSTNLDWLTKPPGMYIAIGGGLLMLFFILKR